MKKTALTYGPGIEKGQEYEVKEWHGRFCLVLIDGEYEIRHRDIFEEDFVDYSK